LRSSDVFFVPDYEVNWYEGLGAAALARQARSPKDAARLWAAAEQSFARYLASAEPAKDRWLEIARTRLAVVKAERQSAEKRRGKVADEEDPQATPP
jgi:hypothetical protein